MRSSHQHQPVTNELIYVNLSAVLTSRTECFLIAMPIKERAPNNIINLSDLDPRWNWLQNEFTHLPSTWIHYSSQSAQPFNWLPKRQSVARFVQAYRAIEEAKKAPSLLVSHGPRPAFYGGRIAQYLHPNLPHLAYSFNFTSLPTGYQRKVMEKAFKQVDRFVVFSSMERKVYAEYFDIDPGRIDMILWSVHEPNLPATVAPIESSEYLCALGSQGRDYATLFAAMRLLPQLKLVVVATAESVEGLPVPENVKIYANIPFSHAQNILHHSRFMVVPLRDNQVPCGHVTLVNGMFSRKAMIVTESEGVLDYIQNCRNGVFVAPKAVNDLARVIEELWTDSAKTDALAEAGNQFAKANCTERTAVKYLENYLDHLH